MATVANRDVEKRNGKIKDIKASIDSALGKDTSMLIFKTLKLVYRMDEDEIVSNQAKFEEVMTRILGRSAYATLKAK